MDLSVIKYCQIKNNACFLNGENIFQSSEEKTADKSLVELYRSRKIKYPKFFKMDKLAKTGFLAVDILLENTELYGTEPKYNTGIFLLNSSASLDTDEVYLETIGDNYFPSPSVFVYTLPNIVMGEISIRHKFFGENIFFVSSKKNNFAFYDYVNQAFIDNQMKYAIVGWVDYYRQKSDALVMLIKKQDKETELKFEKNTILNLYK